MIRSSVDLPPPDGPEQRGQLAGRDRDVDVVEGDEVAERLGDVGDLDAHAVVLLRAQQGDDHDAEHARGRQHEGGRVGGLLVEVLVLLLDDERRRLGLAGEVAGHDLDGAELPQGAREREDHAVDDRPLDAGQRDPQEGLAGVGPEAAGGLLLVVADLGQDRHDLADDQRQGHEAGRHDHARRTEDDLEAGASRVGPNQPCARCRPAAGRGPRRPATPTAVRRSAPTAPACRGTRSAPAASRSSPRRPG